MTSQSGRMGSRSCEPEHIVCVARVMRWVHDRPLSPVAMAIGISILCAQSVAMVTATTPR